MNWISTTGLSPRTAIPIAAQMLASASGALKTRWSRTCAQVVGHLEDAALALHLAERSRGAPATSSRRPDPRVAGHLVVQAGVQEVDHRLGSPASEVTAKAAEVGSTSGE
jgi:hypothetical protein